MIPLCTIEHNCSGWLGPRIIPVNLMQPLLDIVEGLFVRDVIHHDNTMSSSVVRRRNRPESLLSCGVPLIHQNRS